MYVLHTAQSQLGSTAPAQSIAILRYQRFATQEWALRRSLLLPALFNRNTHAPLSPGGLSALNTVSGPQVNAVPNRACHADQTNQATHISTYRQRQVHTQASRNAICLYRARWIHAVAHVHTKARAHHLRVMHRWLTKRV